MKKEWVSPALLSGFMELLPEEQVVFDRIRTKIEEVFQRYGFWPLDTPVIEKSEVLFSKGGGETAKQVYRIDKGDASVEQALRFDLTVPLARYVALHAGELAFPFRRYQIGKVYRGERSQRGRYREFYQCDIDIVGRDVLAIENDAELPSVIDCIFKELSLPPLVFHVNNRRLLNGLFAHLGIDRAEEALRAVDKLDKIGQDGVLSLLEEAGIDQTKGRALFALLAPDTNAAILRRLEALQEEMAPDARELFAQGLDELRRVYALMQQFGMDETAIVLDLSITRGLDYYTGTVFESFLTGYESIGSVCSGGRYEDLASNFTKEHLPGIGVSIGLTRLFYQLQAAGLLHPSRGDYLQAVVLPMGEADVERGIEVVNALRRAGIVSQIYLERGKMKKKFSYADRLGARFAVLIGEEERMEGQLSIKDLQTGEQERQSLEALLQRWQGASSLRPQA